MTDYLTEQEQIALLKDWLKRYGMTILAGIVLAAIITASWRGWVHHRNKVLLHASSIYDEMLTARAQNNASDATAQAQKLLDHYKSTPYAEMASLLLARDAILKKNYPEAIQHLNWVMKKAKNPSIRQIARLRKARVLITQNKSNDALDLLEKINDKAFIGLIDEIRGDAYLSINNKDEARKAYERALSELPNAEVMRPILQMKFDNLASLEQTKQQHEKI